MFVAFLSHYFNIIGMIGVALVLVAYLLLQLDRLSQDSFIFSFMNFFGSILILISLCYSWNLASGVIEIAWLLISLYGVIKSLRLRYKMKKKS